MIAENKRIKVLIVDKNQTDHCTISAMVKDAFIDAAVFLVFTETRGLELAAVEDPDVILLCSDIPEMDTFELCQKSKADKDLCDIPIVLVTSNLAKDESRIRALECGVEAFITKPIDKIELTAQIRAMIKIKSANVEKRKNYFLAFIEASTDMVFLKDEHFRYIVTNRKLDEFFNKASEEIIGKTDFELMSAKSAKQCQQADKMALSTNTAVLSDEIIDDRVFETNKFPVELKSNKTGIGGFIRDISDRKQSQELLYASENKYRRLFESAKDGILILDADTGKINDVNPYLIDLLGYKKEDLVGQMVWEIVAFQNIVDKKDNFLRHQQEEYRQYKNMMLQTRDGRMIEVECGSNVYTANKKKVMQCNIRDISERIHAEAELNRERNLSTKYLDTAAILLLAVDSDGTVTRINKKGCDLLGYAQEEILGKNWYDNFVPISEADEVRNFVKDILEGNAKTAEYHENSIRTVSGEHRMVAWHNTILRDNNGNITGLLSSGLDITEQKLADDALKKSEEKYRLLYTSMNQGMALHEIITDANEKPIDYVFLDINDCYTQLFGITKEMSIGKRITEVMPKVEQYWIETFGKVALSGEPIYYENYLETTGGYYSTYTYSPQKRQFAVLVSDITEQKNQEKKLRYLSYHDQLTGLYNRRFFEAEIKKLDNIDMLPLSCIMGDINGVKLINDAFGHAEGDRLIMDASKILQDCCREGDILARIGGDEFAILMPKTKLETAFEVLKSIQAACQRNNENFSNEVHFISISLGCSTKETMNESFENVMKTAENYMYQRKLLEHKSSHSSIIASITATMIEKSHETEEHSQRMITYVAMIGQELNLSQSELNKLTLLATLHDIGKIGIPERILTKPGRLNEAEWVEMKKHPEIGYRIAMASPELIPIADYILSHHERWDGKGYPQNLVGDKIPLLSRILAVIDAYDAMTQDRPYRNKMTIEAAIKEIIVNAGTQFDLDIAKIFVEKVLKEKFNPD